MRRTDRHLCEASDLQRLLLVAVHRLGSAEVIGRGRTRNASGAEGGPAHGRARLTHPAHRRRKRAPRHGARVGARGCTGHVCGASWDVRRRIPGAGDDVVRPVVAATPLGRVAERAEVAEHRGLPRLRAGQLRHGRDRDRRRGRTATTHGTGGRTTPAPPAASLPSDPGAT